MNFTIIFYLYCMSLFTNFCLQGKGEKEKILFNSLFFWFKSDVTSSLENQDTPLQGGISTAPFYETDLFPCSLW